MLLCYTSSLHLYYIFSDQIITGVHAWEAEEDVLLFLGEPYLTRVEEQEAHYISLRDELRASRKAGKAVVNNNSKPLPTGNTNKKNDLSASLNNSGILSASLTSKHASSIAQAKSNNKTIPAAKEIAPVTVPTNSIPPVSKSGMQTSTYVAPVQDENERGNVSIVYATGGEGEEDYEDDDLTLYTSATEVRETSSICTVRRETPL